MNDSASPESGFMLDPRLAADTAFVADWKLSRVLLMDDARFPWLILVPRRPHLVEFDDMHDTDQILLMRELNRALDLLREKTPCDKLNVGMLGNIVRQLHVHVVARRENDAAWPGPVWGFGTTRRYDPVEHDALLGWLRHEPEVDVSGLVICRRSCDD